LISWATPPASWPHRGHLLRVREAPRHLALVRHVLEDDDERLLLEREGAD